MISEIITTPVTTQSTSKVAFKIKNSAKLINMLIAGLYSDKVKSITREIWSNAWDAHVEAGCADRPFDVSFPNVFDPTFRVRDYGKSLTHEEIETIYTVVGESTKENSNDFNGKWGLGSKSPFAYTDNFTVTAYLNGVKRFYSAIRNEFGEPDIHLMGEEPTTEENGLEVSFPVEKTDFRAFQDAARRISHGFAVKPNVANSVEFSGWPTIPTIISGDGWALVKGSFEGHGSQAYARMGCVLYPIDANALGTLNGHQREILRASFVIDFAMGELEITPSREGLQYGKEQPTAASIIRKVNALLESLSDKMQQGYASCDSYFDACCKYVADLKEPSMPSILRTLITEKSAWRGKKLTTSIELPPFLGMALTTLRRSELARKSIRHIQHLKQTHVQCVKNTVVMLEDLTQDKKVYKAPQRIQMYYVNQNSQVRETMQVVWVRIYSTEYMQTELVQLLDVLDGVKFISVDELPEPVRPVKTVRKPVMARMLVDKNFNTTINLTEENINKGGICVNLERMDPVIPDGMSHPARLTILLRAVGALTDEHIIGIPKSLRAKFPTDKWTDLYAFANDWFAKQDVNIPAMWARRNALQKITRDDSLSFLAIRTRLDSIGADSTARVAIELLHTASKMTLPEVTSMEQLASALRKGACLNTENSDVVIDPYEAQYRTVVEAIAETYPLLEYLNQQRNNVGNSNSAIDIITNYVIMCDLHNKLKSSQEQLEQRLTA